MTLDDVDVDEDEDVDDSSHSILARIITVLLFLLVQAGAVLLVGLTALLLNVVPGWSAELLPGAAKVSVATAVVSLAPRPCAGQPGLLPWNLQLASLL